MILSEKEIAIGTFNHVTEAIQVRAYSSSTKTTFDRLQSAPSWIESFDTMPLPELRRKLFEKVEQQKDQSAFYMLDGVVYRISWSNPKPLKETGHFAKLVKRQIKEFLNG